VSDWLVVSNIALWIAVLVQLMLCLTLFRQMGIVLLGSGRPLSEVGIPAGKRLPALDLRDVWGNQWSTTAYAGRPFLLFFVSVNCVQCRLVLPDVKALAGRSRVDVVPLVFADQTTARRYAEDAGLGGPVVAADQEIGVALDVGMTPFAYAVDGDGFILDKGVLTVPRLREMIEMLERAGASAATAVSADGDRRRREQP
jgi:methylamine dehydrogenase accessory protein MauD